MFWRQTHRAVKPLRTVDILPLVEDGQIALIPTQHWDFHVRLGPIRDLAAAVRCNRIKEFFKQIRTFLLHPIVDRFCANQQ